jgi:hypothetical protein
VRRRGVVAPPATPPTAAPEPVRERELV